MKKLLALVALLGLVGLPAAAQLSTPRVEVGGGYAFRNFAPPPALTGNPPPAPQTMTFPRINQNGWDVNAAFNINNWLAIAGDVDATRSTAPDPAGSQDVTWIYSVMGGPRVYPVGHHRITPFGQVLFGHAYFKVTLPAVSGCGTSCVFTDGSFAFSAGGGLDASITRHFAVRLVEFDYERTAFSQIATPGLSDTNNNFKVKVGAVVRF